MSGSAAAPAKYTRAQNIADRMTLVQTGVPMRTKLGTFGPYTPGQIASIRLRNVGVITGLRVRVRAAITSGGAMTAQSFAPYTIISKFSLTDYNTTERVSCPGWQLYLWNSLNIHRPWAPTGQGSVDTQQALTPTASGNTLYANYYVPLAVDPANDLQGAILAQSVVGEMFLNCTINPTAGGDPQSPYATTNTPVIGNTYIDVWQEYIQMQNPIFPKMDLNTVHEINGMFLRSDNILTGGQLFIDYPNVRSVLGMVAVFVDNAAVTPNGTDIAALNLVANGNTNLREQDPLLVRLDMRNREGGDLPESYYINSERQPIQTWIYSQVQLQFNWGTVTASPAPYLMYGFRSLYAQRTPLPGIAQ